MSTKQYLRRSRGASRVFPIPAPSPIYNHVRCARVARYQHTRQAAFGTGIGLFLSSPSVFIRTDSPSAHRNTAFTHSLLSIFYPFALSHHACKAHPRPSPLSKPMQSLFGQCIDPMTLFPHHVDQFLALRQVSRVSPPPRPPHLFVSLRASTSITDWS